MALVPCIVLAANYLDMDFLLKWSCKKIADGISEGSLASLNGLPDEVQLMVANQLPPPVLLEAVEGTWRIAFNMPMSGLVF
jgi:hypothetical protein